MTEQDDAENWNYATAASKGTIASRYKFNYEMGLGHTTTDERLKGGDVVQIISENNARTLYRRWAEFMDAESWADLYPVKKD
jgi:hypothetical protein